jgi:hypothetical protein
MYRRLCGLIRCFLGPFTVIASVMDACVCNRCSLHEIARAVELCQRQSNTVLIGWRMLACAALPNDICCEYCWHGWFARSASGAARLIDRLTGGRICKEAIFSWQRPRSSTHAQPQTVSWRRNLRRSCCCEELRSQLAPSVSLAKKVLLHASSFCFFLACVPQAGSRRLHAGDALGTGTARTRAVLPNTQSTQGCSKDDSA